jgi:hypothetical protein
MLSRVTVISSALTGEGPGAPARHGNGRSRVPVPRWKDRPRPDLDVDNRSAYLSVTQVERRHPSSEARNRGRCRHAQKRFGEPMQDEREFSEGLEVGPRRSSSRLPMRWLGE